MPTRMQWWRDRVRSHRAIWSLLAVFTAVFTLAAAVMFCVYSTTTLVFHLTSSISRLPPVF
jgi:hypothetical protein